MDGHSNSVVRWPFMVAIDKLGNLVGCHPKLLMIDTYTDDTRLFIAAPDKP